MNKYLIASQILIALTIFNVWILRYRKPTPWRGGQSKNMQEEFQVYGLPVWFLHTINVLKLLLAVLLVTGVWLSELTRPAAVGMTVLMLGAVLMHFKVGDPLKKSLPASVLLLLSLSLAVLA